MIRFQASRQVIKLNVDRDKWRSEEQRKLKWTGYIVWFNVIYHIGKAAIPSFTLISCAYFNESESRCADVTNIRISVMLLLDAIYGSLLLVYIIVMGLMLICSAWSFSRYEAKHHMNYFIAVSLGLGLCFPFVIYDLLIFKEDPTGYSNWRFGYYTDWFAKTLPCVVYLLMKPAEDCFNCFNRLAP